MISPATTPTMYTAFPSALGWFGVELSTSSVERLHFGYPSQKAVLEQLGANVLTDKTALPKWWDDAQKLLVAYANGDSVNLSEIPVANDQRTPFQERVVKNLQRVNYGETVTYGELARRAGSSGAARAVGNQMAKNRVPLLVPCHRVVASGGKLGGFSAPDGVSMKVRLLQMENVDCEEYQLD